tara:strand:+ start:116 stop:352 length:237 start_codon:yes stop_codon:yes gene_type:complete
MPKLRLFQLSDELVERIAHSAADEGKGGWQNLCAEIMRSEVEDHDEHQTAAILRAAKARGVESAIECLKALHAALEDD